MYQFPRLYFVCVCARAVSGAVVHHPISQQKCARNVRKQFNFISHSIINTNSNNLINGAIFLCECMCASSVVPIPLHVFSVSMYGNGLHAIVIIRIVTPWEYNNGISDISTCIYCILCDSLHVVWLGMLPYTIPIFLCLLLIRFGCYNSCAFISFVIFFTDLKRSCKYLRTKNACTHTLQS